MLSYNQWKTLNESLFSTTLGVAGQTPLGVLNSLLDEAKAKGKKKMFGDDAEDDAETGDGEVVEPASEKDAPEDDEVEVKMGGDEKGGCGKCMKSKKKMSVKPTFTDEDDAEAGPEMDAEEGGEEVPAEEDEAEEGDDEEQPCGKKKLPMPVNTPMAAKKKLKKEAYLDDEADWLQSVQSMIGTGKVNVKFDDGFTRYFEDALIPPQDANAEVTESPAPGDVGFAPEQRLGSNFEPSVFDEWKRLANM